jgi:hypothetical protein
VRTLAVVVAIAALSTPALAGPPTAARCDQPPAPAGRGVRAIDWCRAEVGVWGGPLVAGRAEVHLDEPDGQGHDTTITTLRSIDFADVDGDRRPEAMLVLERAHWSAAGVEASRSSDLVIFTIRGGRPHRLTALPIGTPVDDLVVRRGVVTLVSGPDRATTRWRWDRRRQALVERVR